MSTGQIAQRPYSSFRAKYGVNSSPVLGSRMISYTKQRNPMQVVSATAVPVTTTTTNATSNRKAADQTTTDETQKPINKTKTYRNGIIPAPAQSYTKSTSASNAKTISSWENRTFYSSTRSTKSSNLMETNKLVRSSKNACSLHSSNSANSSSSTGTSVESIVPKYGPSGSSYSSTSNGHQQSAKNLNTFNGSQKRAYNTNKMSKENVPHSYANKKTYSSITATPLTASGKHAAGMTAVAPRKYTAKENMHAFSSKFPHGMPFEDEFYKVRSYSVTSDASKYSSYSNYDNNALPFEDEFLRKPSNEPLYVDFSKSIPATVNKSNHNTNKFSGSSNTATNRQNVHHYHNNHQHNSHNIINNDYENFFCKFESVTKGSNSNNNYYKNSVCDARNKVNTAGGVDQPVVYVAVASWVPKCNQQQYHTNLLEPMTKGQVYVYNFYVLNLTN